MFRARDPQRNLFSARNQYRELLKPGSFYALLAEFGEQLFDDYKFEYLYCEDNGRPCVPPGQMFTLLLLQLHDGCSDEESVERVRCDVRWAAALDVELGSTFCGRSTLQEFRARVLLNEVAEKQFNSILKLARDRGILKGALQVALDTTPILGRGAVQDTYNLIASGIRKMGGVLARIERVSPEHWSGLHDFSRYWDATSLKGEAGIDWSDAAQRRVFLNSLVADAQRVLMLADRMAKSAIKDDAAKIEEAAALLRRLIAQDTEPEPQPPKKSPPGNVSLGTAEPPAPETTKAEQTSNAEPASKSLDAGESSTAEPNSHLLGQMLQIRRGVATDRVISVNDPDMRHGRKSSSKLFDGFKLSVVVETGSKLFLGIDIMAANSGDNEGALGKVRQAEANTGLSVSKTIADCAYGDGPTRQDFDEAGIELSAKVPSSPSKDLFPKSRFVLDLTNMVAQCPAGQTTTDYEHSRLHGEITNRFRFSAQVCQSCPHKEPCLRAIDKRLGWGRTVILNPHEALIQKARAHQASPAFREDVKARQSVEHGLARLTQLGVRQARYIGKQKTKYQALMIAMVANLTTIGRRLLVVAATVLAQLERIRRARLNRAADEIKPLVESTTSATKPILVWRTGLLGNAA